MNDKVKTKKQLIQELIEARQRIAELENSRTENTQAEELFHGLSKSATIPLFIIQEGKFLLVNPQFQRLSGYSQDELLGRDCSMLVIPEGTIQAMALALEMRDPYTAGHQRRVAELACAIAREMGFVEEQIERIRLAGVIHDIGKLYVPAEILSKPTRLSEIEYNLVKVHSQVGYEILKTIEFPWPVAQITLQHHELVNGS